MIKIKPLPKTAVDPKQAGETASTKQIAKERRARRAPRT